MPIAAQTPSPRHHAFVQRRRRRYMLRRILLLTALLLLLLSTVLVLRARAAGGPVAIHYRVEAGDTLWSIAIRHTLAPRDPRELVDVIQRSNHLSSAQIQPGQMLDLPATLFGSPGVEEVTAHAS